MQIEFTSDAAPISAEIALAVVAFEDAGLCDVGREIDQLTGGALTRAMAGRFRGRPGDHLALPAPSGLEVAAVLVIGAGPRSAFDLRGAEVFAAEAWRAAEALGVTELWLSPPGGGADAAAHSALGARLAAYRFNRHKTVAPADGGPSVRRVQVKCTDIVAAIAAYVHLAALGDGVAFARDLISEPANILHPAEFGRRLLDLRDTGLEVEILGEEELTALGMGALLGVGQGSARETQLAVLQWKGSADPAAPPLALIGKGVTFDTGGVSIKPADGMEDMKWDMGGAGAIAGAMLALARRKAPANVVAVLGLVENMVDGAAQRPGDVVTSLSGQTIEVINTDAEGRLVLADALWYCQQRFAPVAMIDVATLTGAIMIALGGDYGGLYCEDDGLAQRLLDAGRASGEPLWRMPMPPAYDRHIESRIADVKNVAVGIGRLGGASIAARFLRRFTNGATWAHLDISGPTWRDPSVSPTAPPGATGYGVRLLDRLVDDLTPTSLKRG